MAEIKIELSDTGNNKVSATNSIVNSISKKIQQLYNDILLKLEDIKTWYSDILTLKNEVETKVSIAIESVENSIIEDCQGYVNSCKEYATSNEEIETGLYSAKYYAEKSKDWGIANDIIETSDDGEDLYSAKYYAEKAKEYLDNIDDIIGEIENGSY